MKKKHSPKRKSQQEKSGFSDIWAGALGAALGAAKGQRGNNKGIKRVEARNGQTY